MFSVYFKIQFIQINIKNIYFICVGGSQTTKKNQIFAYLHFPFHNANQYVFFIMVSRKQTRKTEIQKVRHRNLIEKLPCLTWYPTRSSTETMQKSQAECIDNTSPCDFEWFRSTR